ncbi:MAG: hypothetical protein PF637_00905 [Spirochaetes bacterium]|jgi:flagellin|nr:hypothetical protein [Spirochaetota bacterium]
MKKTFIVVLLLFLYFSFNLAADSAGFVFVPNNANFSILAGQNAYRIIGHASSAETQFNKSLKQAASGQRISVIGVDPAGKAVAEKMESLLQEIRQRSVNARDWNSYLRYLDGILADTVTKIQRIRLLGVKASSGIMGEFEREIIQSEIDMLISAIRNDMKHSTFNKKKIDLPITPAALGLTDIDVVKSPSSAISIADSSLDEISVIRSQKGAESRMLELRIEGESYHFLNLSTAQSGIRDVNMSELSTKINLQRVKIKSSHGVLYKIMKQ